MDCLIAEYPLYKINTLGFMESMIAWNIVRFMLKKLVNSQSFFLDD